MSRVAVISRLTVSSASSSSTFFFGLVLSGVVKGADRLPGEVGDELLVLGGELRVSSALIHEGQDADGPVVVEQGDRERDRTAKPFSPSADGSPAGVELRRIAS